MGNLTTTPTSEQETTATGTLPFAFGDAQIRVLMIDHEPWFVATDVCAALGLIWKGSGNSGTLAALDDDEKGLHSMQTLGGKQSVAIINESGLYILVMRSHGATKPGTVPHRFRKWVTSEVLPAIRKTGGYGVQRIDVEAMMTEGLKASGAEIPQVVMESIDTKTWDLTREAHAIIRNHLLLATRYVAEIGSPRYICEDRALAALNEVDLGRALAHTWVRKIEQLRDSADTYIYMAQDFSEKLRSLQS